MQLLDSPSISRSAIPEALQTALQNLVQNVQIQSPWCIRHPDYKPLELPAESVERFQVLPQDIQTKYLNQQLCHFLYGLYYNGSLKTALALDGDGADAALSKNLENNTFLGVDVAFYDRLHSSNQGDGYFSSDWQVVREESDGSIAVTKGGLTLHIERDRHLADPQQAIEVGEAIAIRLPRNLVQNGFYMAVGNAGAQNEDAIVRVYFHLSSEGAVAVMESLTRQFNAISLPFSFKALYNPSDYQRYDAAVLYFDKTTYAAVQPILQAVYQEHRAHFRPEIPLFTKELAPGLGLAEEPDQKFTDRESFGLNRCQIVANGLLAARQAGDESPEARYQAIVQQFALFEVALSHPYLNAHSEDFYTPLAL